MKLGGKSKNLTIGAMLAAAVLVLGFWHFGLSPKREEAAELSDQVGQVEASLSQHRAEVSAAEEARKGFPVDYQKLVVLGKAVPGDDDTASLLVQVSGIAERAGVEFHDIKLSSSSGSGEEAASAAPAAGGAPVSATEAAASLLPLGAAIGPAGLAAMPYTLTFNGSFFQIADFIKGLDSLVETQKEEVAVEGRLITINGFSLAAGEDGFPSLTASFGVTTYVTPPGEGITPGAAPTGLGLGGATPAAATLGGAP
jgi:Tfp pilus assembly protein PilO